MKSTARGAKWLCGEGKGAEQEVEKWSKRRWKSGGKK